MQIEEGHIGIHEPGDSVDLRVSLVVEHIPLGMLCDQGRIAARLHEHEVEDHPLAECVGTSRQLPQLCPPDQLQQLLPAPLLGCEPTTRLNQGLQGRRWRWPDTGTSFD